MPILRYPLGTSDYTSFFPRVQSLKPDILCMINFGRDLVNAAKQAYDFGITKQVKIITPVLLISARMAAGPEPFEGVVGAQHRITGKSKTRSAARKRSTTAIAKHIPERCPRLRRVGLRGRAHLA